MKNLINRFFNQSESFEKSACLQEIQLSYKRKVKLENRFSIKQSSDASKYAKAIWDDTIELNESFYVLYLDRKNNVLGWINLAKGGVSGVAVDQKILFATGLKALCSGIIVLHNHPSGNLKPSEADRNITNKLLKICNLLDIVLLDHIIITEESFFSFADEGLL